MKRLINKTKGVVKGMPTAVLFSIIFHAAILLIAGIVAIKIAITPKPLDPTKPPPVDIKHKAIPPKKPKMKQKPKKPGGSTRIVSKSKISSMDFQLPEVEGSGKTGFGKALGDTGSEIGIKVNLGDLTMFGSKNRVAKGNDFVGTFYSMMMDVQGRKTSMTDEGYLTIVKKFLDNDWSPQVFLPYYQSPNKLYATQFFIPRVTSERAPTYFGIDPTVIEPLNWVVHYTGKFKSKTDGRFRFRAFADDIMMVRVNGELVLNAAQTWNNNKGKRLCPNWDVPEERYYSIMPYGGSTDSPGSPPLGIWFDLKAGETNSMEVLLGETGGAFQALLVIEQYEELYPENPGEGPILPVFKTAETPESVLEEIMYDMAIDKAQLEGGPVFNVY